MQERMRRLPPLPLWVNYVLLGMIITSLFLHMLTWLAIFQARNLVRQEVLTLAEQVGGARDDRLSADFAIRQVVPVNAEVPIREQLTFPVNTTVDINEEVIVPIAGFEFPVPVQASVPISATIPIEIDQTVRISTTVDLDFDIPIDIPIGDTSLEQYLEDLEQQLRRLAERI